MTDPGPMLRVSVGSRTNAAAVLDAAREESAVPVREVGPTGASALDPLVAATLDGTTAFHAACTPDRVRTLCEALEDGTLPSDRASAVVDHDRETETLPVPDGPPLGVGVRRTLARAGWARPDVPAAFEPLVSTDADPDATRERVAAAGLRGRGRGDARVDDPVSEAWTTAREADGEPVVVVNANEADPTTDADRLLVESVTVAVLDGALAVAAAVGADDVVVHLPASASLAASRLRAAADRLDAAVDVVGGPEDYLAGEPTMALEALEGADRLEARRRPPGPASYGLFGRPTVVHTPRTLVAVRRALAGATAPTRLVTVSGDVRARATVELPAEGSLATALDAVSPTDGVKMACVGGRFGGLTRELDVGPTASALRSAGLGTNGALEVLGRDRCAVATAGERASAASESTCGRCVPCREGTRQVTDLLRAVYDGEYEASKIRELVRVIGETSLCSFGRDAARPVRTAIERFEPEFVAHAEGRCPTGACEEGSA
ncbi:MAG: NADH-ubiquinone oxidoreductase-F iron-sulfur binding region domain-containing protein [Haloarculaceae archaeon]